MRITTLLRQLIGVITLHVRGLSFEDHGLVLQVVPRWRKPRCGACEKRAPGYDQSRARRWRHLELGRMRIWLEYAPRRVQCPRCGVRSEQVPWAAQGSRFTWDFEELVAYLAQVTDKTRVTELMGISWTTVGAIVERVVARRLDPSRLEGLRRIELAGTHGCGDPPCLMAIPVAPAASRPLILLRPQRFAEFLLEHRLHGFKHSSAQKILNVLAQLNHIRVNRGIL